MGKPMEIQQIADMHQRVNDVPDFGLTKKLFEQKLLGVKMGNGNEEILFGDLKRGRVFSFP